MATPTGWSNGVKNGDVWNSPSTNEGLSSVGKRATVGPPLYINGGSGGGGGAAPTSGQGFPLGNKN